MHIITKISSQIKNKERYNIFINETFAFSVDENVLVRYGLKKGMELSDLDITQIKYDDEIRKAFNEAVHYLSFRMRSELEIRSRLRKNEWEDPVIEEVINRLKKHHYIDDLEFAIAFVRTHANSGKKGIVTIRQDLKQKGINEKQIEIALDEYSKEAQVNDAIELGSKYANRNKKLSERMLKQKIEYMLANRGFPFDVINKAMESIEYEKSDDSEWAAILAEGEKAKRRYRKYSGLEYEQRMKQALYRKGFPMDLINKYVAEEEND